MAPSNSQIALAGFQRPLSSAQNLPYQATGPEQALRWLYEALRWPYQALRWFMVPSGNGSMGSSEFSSSLALSRLSDSQIALPSSQMTDRDRSISLLE